MIKKFKKFKLLNESSTSHELIEQIDDDDIEKWYDKHYKADLSEIISISSQQNIMYFFDDKKYKEDFIKDYINNYEFDEFDENDLLTYLKKNIDDKNENKILEIYNRNNYDEDDEDSEKETEYSEYMLEELDKDELIEVIEYSNEEDNCTKWIINWCYSNSDGVDIFDEFCGFAKKNDIYGNYKYGSFEPIESSKLYSIISEYIDDDKLIKNWNDNIDFSYKKEQVEENIYNSTFLQKYLIKKDPDNVEALINLWMKYKFKSKNIGNIYIFQKAYINKYIKDNIEEDDNEEDKNILIEDALEYLHDKFGVNDKISEEYRPHMWKIFTQDNYNL